jgi:tRNA-specific 2-thiouridylase
VLDLAELYNRTVLDPAADDYRSGRTPNPCVRCNRFVKFEAIPEALRAHGIAVDAFATGHYARVRWDESAGRWLLLRGRDRRKDQSYFLYLLTQELLARTRFPLGELDKGEVRALARARGLPVAAKEESQDFAAGPYPALLGIAPTPGPILDAEGHVLGTHQGIASFTVGQRRGLGIAAAEPLYVTALDPRRNAVVVGSASRLGCSELVAGAAHWIALPALTAPRRAHARIRYRHTEAEALLTPLPDGRVRVTFTEAQQAVTPGQAVVFFDGEVVLGGGTIERAVGA